MIALIEQYPLTAALIAFFVGGCWGLLARGLAAVSAESDKRIERESQNPRQQP